MRDVVLLGGGGHANVVLDVLLLLGHHVIGFAAPSRDDARVALPYLGRDGELLDQLNATSVAAALGIGMMRVDERRMRLLEAYHAAGVVFPALVAPGATVCGGVTIGAHALVGAGATLVHGIDVCSGVLVGAGATVVCDVTEPGTYLGTPARRV